MFNKHIYHIVATVLACCLFAACSKDDNEGGDVPSAYHLLRVQTDDFIADDASVDAKVCDFAWVANDLIGIYPVSPKANNEIRAYYLSLHGTSNNIGLFTGRGWEFDKKETYLAYYPYSEVNFNNESHKAIKVSYGEQKQTGNGSMLHLRNYDYMYTSEMKGGDEYLEVRMKHVGCMVEFELHGVPTDVLMSKAIVSLKSGKVMTTDYTMDLSSYDGTLTPAGDSHSLTLGLQSTAGSKGILPTADGLMTLYLMMPPADYSDDTFVVTLFDIYDNDYTYMCGGKRLVASHVYKCFQL